jgi:NTE family protein
LTERSAAGRSTHSPAFVMLDILARVFSPYEPLPWAPNPLEAVLAESVDFDRLARAPIKLFVTATNLRTGRGRVFRNADITPQVLLASACLPTLFQAVEIDGEAYWDGGYSGNPTITPLVRECRSEDTIIVPINPVERPGTPRSAREILNRLNEVSFNAVLLKELHMIALLRQIADPGNAEGARWAGMRVHFVRNPLMVELGWSSKFNAEWKFLTMLRDEGRHAADVFLAEHGDALGHRSSMGPGHPAAGGLSCGPRRRPARPRPADLAGLPGMERTAAGTTRGPGGRRLRR